MHIDDAGHDRAPGEVEDPGIRRDLDVVADRLDSPAGNEHGGVFEHRAPCIHRQYPHARQRDRAAAPAPRRGFGLTLPVEISTRWIPPPYQSSSDSPSGIHAIVG